MQQVYAVSALLLKGIRLTSRTYISLSVTPAHEKAGTKGRLNLTFILQCRYWKFTASKRWDQQNKKKPMDAQQQAARPTGAPQEALQEQLAGLRRKAAFRRASRSAASSTAQGVLQGLRWHCLSACQKSPLRLSSCRLAADRRAARPAAHVLDLLVKQKLHASPCCACMICNLAVQHDIIARDNPGIF